MRKIWKWIASIVLILCVLGFAILFNIFSDLKSTAQEMYTPIHEDMSNQRVRAVDVASEEPFSALILGVDERDGDVGRSDTMIVLTINPTLKTTKMLSIPRDTYTEIVGKGFKDKINHAYAFGGMEMAIETVENLLSIPIDYVAQVNMESFVDIIEIVGGITVDNPLDFHYQDEHFPKGELALDGEKALKYVRMRYDDPAGDFGRQNRQKQVIQGVLKEGLSLQMVWNYKSIFKTLEDHVEINVSFADLFAIQKNYRNSFGSIEQLYMNKGVGTMMDGIYYYVPDEHELQAIEENLRQHMEM